MWPSLVINLADNTERMARSARQLSDQAIPFSRIEAVNGWQMTPEALAAAYDARANARRAKRPLVPAEIGCYLSHVEAWRMIADGTAPGGFVFEDDFAAEEHLAETLELLTDDAARTDDWDMVKLFSFDRRSRLLRPRPLGRFTLGIPYRVPTCLIGYGLTRQAAARLLQKALPVARPVDEDQKFFWETGLRVALVTPPPIKVGDQQTVTGTIGQSRREAARTPAAGAGRTGLSQTLHSLAYRAGYTARLHWHRMRGTGL